MPYYRWSGIKIDGSLIRGSLFATSVEMLERRLLEQNVALTTCAKHRVWYILPISDDQKVNFFEQLGVLLAAGVPLVGALELVCQQLDDMRMAAVVEHIARFVQEGHQLHDAMGHYVSIFSPEMRHMVEVGAQAGNLSLALTALSDYIRAQQGLKKQLRTALVVPFITATFFMVIFIVTLFAMVPRYAELFTSMGKPLPYLTHLLFSLYTWLAATYVYVLLFLCVSVAFGIYMMWYNPRIKAWFDARILEFPICGVLVKDVALLQFFRSLALLQEGGMSVVPACQIALCAINNSVIRASVLSALHDVATGHRLSFALQGVLSERQEMIFLITVGEESGTLPIMVKKIARLYDERVIKKLRAYTLLVQPVCMILLGVMVALLIAAVYMPLFNLAELV